MRPHSVRFFSSYAGCNCSRPPGTCKNGSSSNNDGVEGRAEVTLAAHSQFDSVKVHECTCPTPGTHMYLSSISLSLSTWVLLSVVLCVLVVAGSGVVPSAHFTSTLMGR